MCEVHCRRPCAKVLFPEGHALFLGAWPSGPRGVLVDEDGDAHRFELRDAMPQCGHNCPAAGGTSEVTLDLDDLGPAPPAVKMRRGLGGWGFVVAERDEARPGPRGANASARSGRRKQGRVGLGRGSGLRAPPPFQASRVGSE
ncbi:unnamed protein product [Prorocentrum cordatum]|uniref:Uncharacterized protein n=1 Tax=Prorocentrum cordatum TaxID=2364126 RepID=A0ABN9TF48_9DINO|nr:unnamed protein product [Polarella glacialis]